MNPDNIAPTAQAWAGVLTGLLERAAAVHKDDHAGRHAVVDELMEFIVYSPPVAADLDALAADAIDDLLVAEVGAHFEHMAARARTLAEHAAALDAAAVAAVPAEKPLAAEVRQVVDRARALASGGKHS